MTQLELALDAGIAGPRLPRRPVHAPFRLFLAALPPQDVISQASACIHDVCAGNRLSGTFLRPRRYHVSQLFIGDYREEPAETIGRVKAVLARASLPQFDVVFDRLVSFGRRSIRPQPTPNRPLVLISGSGLPELRAVNDMLRALFGVPAMPQHAVPHMTLFYGAHDLDLKLPQPIGWRARDLTLILNAGGEYQRAGNWPLRR